MAETAGTVENLAPGYDSAKANVLASYANTQQVAQNVTQNVANTANVLANQNMQTNVASTGVSATDAQAMNDRFSRLVRGVSAEMGIMAQSQELALAKTEAALNSYLTSLRAALPAVEARMQASLDAAMARFGGTGGGDDEEGGTEELDVINESLGTNITEDDIDPNAGTGAFGEGDTEIINNFQLQAEGAINPDGIAGELYAGVDPNLAQQANELLSAMMDPFTVDVLGGAIKIESAVENIIETITKNAELRGQPLTMAQIAQLEQWGILATQAHYEYEGTGTPEMTADAIKAYGEAEIEELRANRPGVGGNRTLDEIAEASMLAHTSAVSERATAKQEADAAKEEEMRLSEAPTATTSYEVAGQFRGNSMHGPSHYEREAEKKRLDGLIDRLETKAENQPQQFTPQDNAQLERLKNQRKWLDPYSQGGGNPSGSMKAYWEKFGKGPATLTWSDPEAVEKLADPINIDIAWQSQPDVVAAFAKSVRQQREKEAQEARRNPTLVGEDPIATLASRMGQLYKPGQAVSKKEEEKAWKDTFGWASGFKGF